MAIRLVRLFTWRFGDSPGVPGELIGHAPAS